MRKQWNRVLLVILILVVVIFSVLNVDPVNINFGFTTVEMPLVVVIIGTLLIGLLIAVIGSTSMVLKERNEKRKLRKQLDDYDEEKAKEQESLKEELEQSEQEKRKLKRRIQNMEAKQETKANNTNNSTDV